MRSNLRSSADEEMSALPITEKLPPATLISSPSHVTVGGAKRTASSVPSPAALKDNPGYDAATLPSTGIGEQVIDLPCGSGLIALVVTPSPAEGSVANFWNESDSASNRKSSMSMLI
mmetsp:Transcript_38549/g.86878  ORF Transcript_38549/g.86878 Transcript_38549/m.86878 type:complete len:117 (-) Transcript_38549:2-352(-)